MEKKEKTFNIKLYAVFATVGVAVALTLIVFFTFKSKYTAFYPDEVARNYVDTVVQTGDGYNAYKNALVSKNSKYGNFIRKNYINPMIYRDTDYKIGDDIKKFKGYNDNSYKGEKTNEDNGSLQGQVIEKMYPIYQELVSGWDDYDRVFTTYFEKLCEVRKEVFGDDYMSDEIMFTVLESNVKTYGESLTGTKEVVDDNTGNKTSEKTIGAYQKAYGEDYRLVCEVADEKEIDLGEYKSAIAASDAYALYGVAADDISEAKIYEIEVKTADGNVVTKAEVTVAKIGSSWYVDGAQSDTSGLYDFCA